MMTNGCWQGLKKTVARLLAEDEGQDLIEYALLTGAVAVGAMLIFPVIRTRMAAAYLAWNAGVQAIWEPPPPI
jgi:Flp pilus assembly pilin Flp